MGQMLVKYSSSRLFLMLQQNSGVHSEYFFAFVVCGTGYLIDDHHFYANLIMKASEKYINHFYGI